MGTFIRRKFFMILAILLICAVMFPLVFTYSLSLAIQRVVGKRAAAAIDRFWDAVGKPYEYLLKLAN
jgi:small neutral amino acid transporter SnatA (MarC family)